MIDVRDNTRLLISQHFGTQLEEIATRWLATMQEYMAAPVNAFDVDIESATGFALDEIGERLGFGRPRIEDESVVYFGFSDEDLSFGQGVLATSDDVFFPGIPVSDTTYRCLLKARAVALRSTGSRRDFEDGLRCLSANGEVLVQGDPRSALSATLQHAEQTSDQIQGLTVFQTSNSESIIGMRGNRRLLRVSHVTGEIEDLPLGLRPTLGNQIRGLGSDGDTLIATFREGSTYRSSNALALDPAATTMDWTADDPGFLNFVVNGETVGEPTSVLRFAGDGDRYLYCANQRLYYKEDASPTALGILRRQPGDVAQELRGLTHDYALTNGHVGTGSTLYVASVASEIWSLACHDDETQIDVDACQLVVDLNDVDGFPPGGAINALVYHDGVFYGSWEAGAAQRFWIYRAGSASASFDGPAFDVHIYHPNRHYRDVVARNIDALVARPAGVSMTLHTHAEA